jgi:uncharacterized protein (UPF0332 family)
MIKWCIKQKKGLELVEENNNLSKEYLIKAENALKAIKALEDNIEWQISAAYYSAYFSLYSILMKIGVKSEIHACTIKFAKIFLNSYFIDKNLDLLKKAMKARIDLQYYTNRTITKYKHKTIINFAYEFHVKCKQRLEDINEDSINKIRSDFLSYFE